MIDDVVDAIHHHWDEACDQARLTTTEREGLWQREVLNDYVLEGYTANI
ncbi:hypothetical protein [Angustibacter sp. Root456]|nr:hypothetical protein [Angustibacter sp. Root456]